MRTDENNLGSGRDMGVDQVRKLPKNVYESGNRFVASVKHKGKRVYLGSFGTPEEAEAKVKLFRHHYPRAKGTAWQPGDEI